MSLSGIRVRRIRSNWKEFSRLQIGRIKYHSKKTMTKPLFLLCSFLLLLIPLHAQHYAEGREFQLGAPQMDHDGQLFQDSVLARLSLGWEGAQIRYTLDGSPPDEKSALYEAPLVIRQDARLQARAFHPSFRASESIAAEFVRSGQKLRVVSASLEEAPSPQYAGRGAAGLVDGRKGSANFRDGEWLGFNGADAVLHLQLKEAVEASELLVSSMADPGSWIFPPSAIEVRASKDGINYQELGSLEIAPPGAEDKGGAHFYKIAIPTTRAQFWEVTVGHFGLLPAWHQGAGTPAWLFVDELIFR